MPNDDAHQDRPHPSDIPNQRGEAPRTEPQLGAYSPVDDRREATRFQREPYTDFAVIWQTPGDEILAEVHDESLTGLGILLEDVADLRQGCEVDVVYTGTLMRGEVKHIDRQSDGRFLVGLQCQRVFPTNDRDFGD